MLLWFFKLKKIQINQGIWAPARFATSYYGNSVFLLSEREGRTGNIWLMVTTYGLRCAWSTRHDPQSQIFSRLTRPCQSIHIYAQDCRLSRFSFLLTYFILASHGAIRWAVRLFPTLLVPLRTFLVPGFFHKNQDQ